MNEKNVENPHISESKSTVKPITSKQHMAFKYVSVKFDFFKLISICKCAFGLLYIWSKIVD